MEPTWIKLTILDELYADILGTNYSRLMGPIIATLLGEGNTPEEVEESTYDDYYSLLNEGLIAEIGPADAEEEIVITLKGREVYEQFL